VCEIKAKMAGVYTWINLLFTKNW